MKRSALILLMITVLLFTGCFADPELDFENVASVEIMTDSYRIAVTDPVAVAELTEGISKLDFERTAEPEGGYLYTVYYTLTWYNSDGVAIESIEITEENGYQIAHDGVVYRVGADLALDVDFIAQLAAVRVCR